MYSRLGEEARLVEELGRLEVRQAAVQRLLGQLGNGLQQRQGHLGANDGGGLQQALLLRRQPVDARRQHRLHRGRHLAWSGAAAPGDRRPGSPDQDPGLHQGAHALLQEERDCPRCARSGGCLSGARLGSSPSSACEQLVGALSERDAVVVRLSRKGTSRCASALPKLKAKLIYWKLNWIP